MKKVVKIKGLCSRPLQRRILEAGESERAALLETLSAESDWMIERMQRKGYELEAIVAGMYGIFTRSFARGTLEPQRKAAEQR